MKIFVPLFVSLTIFTAVGCTDRKAEARELKAEADAKAQAESARKEMEKLPKAFQTPDYFKKNDTPKTPSTAETKRAGP